MIRKSFAIILAAAAVMTGCSKENIPELSAGTPMTINVSIDNVASKTSYETDGGALKVEWVAGDQISIVSFGADGIARTCDTFTTAEGGAPAAFTGTYTGASDAETIKVFYPAFTAKGEIFDVSGWATPIVPGRYSSPSLAISDSKVYCRSNYGYINQLTNNDPSHLKYYDLMCAKVSSVDALANVSLVKNSSVIKLVANISEIPDGTLIKRIEMRKSDFTVVFNQSNWGYASQEPDFARKGTASTHTVDVYFGTNASGRGGNDYVTGITKAAGENTLVGYIPIIGEATMKAGSEYTFSVGTGDAGVQFFSKTITLAKDIHIPMGTCYTFTATVSK